MASCRGRLGKLGPLHSEQSLFDSGGVWLVDQTESGIRLILRKGPPPGKPYHLLELNKELSSGSIVLDPSDLEDGPQPFLLRDPLHELWVSFMLMRGLGLLVHGCGVKIDGKVHIFVGESGAGKSTLARVFDDLKFGHILSDDRLVIRTDADDYSVYGTPWHGEAPYASPESGRLATINFLHKAPKSALEVMQPEAAASALFLVCFLAGWPRTGMDFILKCCTEIATRVPCRKLLFTPDQTAIEAAAI